MKDAGVALCNQDCANNVCLEVLSSVVDAARAGYQDLDQDHASITLTGKVSAHDRSGDDAVDDLGPSQLTGNWGKDPVSNHEDAVTGDLKSVPAGESSLLL
ncbi:MAG: hypothetical protein QM778_31340 [Myxococcales bacterium]